ncbi:substrate-binding domain-containing protein [Sphingobacterium sp. LRF_L2]|uniref:substrate-binding domain-containing protein n=1 Tax=Sphingobacterium sp. LRF_L2 TaxID=3369421 RepID=UPI003F62BD38
MNIFYRYCFFIILPLFICCKKEKTSKYTIAFSQCIGNDAWRQTMLEEMKRELSFYPDLEFIYLDAGGSNEKQIAQIQELMKSKVDLLIVSPNEADPLTPIVDSIFQKNIPVIVTDRKTSSGLYNAYVGADNIAIGRLAGKYIEHLLPEGGQIAIMKGLIGSSASKERLLGLQQILNNSKNLQLNLELSGDWKKETAYRQAKKHIEQLKTADIILAFNDQMGLGIHQALTEYGLKEKKIIGVDALAGNGNGLEQISQGNLYASMLYPTGGTEAIRIAMAILEHKPYVRDNILGTLVIDRENAALLDLQSKKIQEQQIDIDKRQTLIVEQLKTYKDQRTTLNILVVSLVLSVIFGGVAIIVLKSNWEKNKHLELQNTEIRSQQQRIIEMNQQIKDVAEAKSLFFTNVSHEFKTPLTLILAPLEILSKEKNISKEGVEQIIRIRRNAKKMQTLVTNLIDIHRQDEIKPKLQISAIFLDEFVRQILANFKPLAQQNHIALSFKNTTQIERIWIDEYLMEQALSNILSNAFKYTKKHGRIEVLVEENTFGDFFYLRIIDNGMGISPSDIDHVFEPFYKGSQADGSGIGLSYVKQIVELHHGQVTVSSKEGVGSSFTFRLPTDATHLGDLQLNAESTSSETLPSQEVDNYENSTIDQTVKFNSSHVPTILIIDDHQDIRLFLGTILGKRYNLQFSKNLAEAQTTLKSEHPDLIISDIMLPDGSGLDLLKQLKNGTTSSVPVLLLSALDTTETKIEGLQLMADAYLTKPFEVDHLLAVVENLIESRKQLKEHYSSVIVRPTNSLNNANSLTQQDQRFLQHLDILIEERLSDPKLTVEEIAESLHISRVQLYRKAKNLLNCSINEYVLQRRLQKSKHLILEGLTINEIADRVGFSSATYFTAAFKKQFGLTPSAFKKDVLKH